MNGWMIETTETNDWAGVIMFIIFLMYSLNVSFWPTNSQQANDVEFTKAWNRDEQEKPSLLRPSQRMFGTWWVTGCWFLVFCFSNWLIISGLVNVCETDSLVALEGHLFSSSVRIPQRNTQIRSTRYLVKYYIYVHVYLHAACIPTHTYCRQSHRYAWKQR